MNRGDLAIIMMTQCNVDSMSALCTAYLKDRGEHEHPIKPWIENGLAFMFSGSDDSIMKATTARIHFLPKINNKL